MAVEGVPSGHHGNGKIHAWCFIAGGYIRLSVPYFREWKIGLAGGISFPNSLHSHHSDFAEANPSDTDSRYHSPSPKIEYYGLSMSFVFFSALMCGVCRPLHVLKFSCASSMFEAANLRHLHLLVRGPMAAGLCRVEVEMGCIRCILSTCVLQNVLPKYVM